MKPEDFLREFLSSSNIDVSEEQEIFTKAFKNLL